MLENLEVRSDVILNRSQRNGSLYTHAFDRISGVHGGKKSEASRGLSTERNLFDAIAGFAAAHLAATDVAGVIRTRFVDAAGTAISDETWTRLGVGTLPELPTICRHLQDVGFGDLSGLQTILLDVLPSYGAISLVVPVRDGRGRVIGLRQVTPRGLTQNTAGEPKGLIGWRPKATASEVRVTSSLAYFLAISADAAATPHAVVADWTDCDEQLLRSFDGSRTREITLVELSTDSSRAVREAAERGLAKASVDRVHIAAFQARSTAQRFGVNPATPPSAPAVDHSPDVTFQTASGEDSFASVAGAFERIVASSARTTAVVVTEDTLEQFEAKLIEQWSIRSSERDARERLRLLAGRYRVVQSEATFKGSPELDWVTSLLDDEAITLVDATRSSCRLWWQEQTVQKMIRELASRTPGAVIAVLSNHATC